MAKLASNNGLSSSDVSKAFDVVMRGEATHEQIAGLLLGIKAAGETAEIVAGAAQSLRDAMVRLPAKKLDSLVDTCGTGGGTITTFNISTAAALVAAGAGVRIAKHGNRSFTSKCGSADVLEALGVNIEASVAEMAGALEDNGIVFMFAPTMHPAMRHVGPVRKQLGVPTVMNIIGPLANPAGVQRQVIGVADMGRMELIASALQILGTRHSLVVHGEPGIDEISPLGTTHVIELKDGRRSEWTINPKDFGIEKASAQDLAGGDARYNADVIESLLKGAGHPTAVAAVALNAAAAIYVSGVRDSYAGALEVARNAITAQYGFSALQLMRAAQPAKPY